MIVSEYWKAKDAKVVEMRARGLSQTEIALELQVSEASISLDMQYLCNQALT
jgi:transcriptional regulator